MNIVKRVVYPRGDMVQRMDWLFTVQDVLARTSPWEQLLAGFRSTARRGLSVTYVQWMDPGAWRTQVSVFDAALWPGIGDLLGSYRSLAGRRLDVRRQDAPLEAWLSTAPRAVTDYVAAITGQSASYHVPTRRVTMDQHRSEWIHDLSFLKAVLTLTEPEPFTESQVPERWAGSTRRRQRSRHR